MTRRGMTMTLSTIVLASALAMAQAKDVAGCKDSPLITRFPGSVITACADKPDEAFSFEMGSAPQKRIEGEFHQINYSAPGTVSKAEIIRNLDSALRTAGFTFDYDSGGYGDLTAHKGKVWIGLSVSGSTYRQTILIETQLTQEVVVNAAALAGGLTTNGHAVVTGIHFDTGNADVKSDSAAALQEVAKLLKADATLTLYVVGHTDNVGDVTVNLDLSRRRAAAVITLLTTQHGVAADRLQPFGNGPYAPIASNDSEDGRALNRRVEIVKR